VGAERGGKKWVLGVAFPRKGPSRSVEVRETGRVQMMSAQEAEEYSAQLRSYRDGDNEMGTGDGDTTRTTTGLRWMSTQGGLCSSSFVWLRYPGRWTDGGEGQGSGWIVAGIVAGT
jgi:hypothetical protein